MNIEECILGRRTIHDYDGDRKVDRSILERALELAMWSQNHKMTNPWAYCLCNENHRKALADFYVFKKADGKPEPVQQAVRAKIMNPSDLIVLLQPIAASEFQAKEDYATLAQAVQNMSLFLWSKGIGSKWSTGPITEDKSIYELFEISEQHYQIIGFFWVGYPSKVPAAKPRPALKDIVL